MLIDHLNLKLLIFLDILQVLRFDFKKFRILEILNFTHVLRREISLSYLWKKMNFQTVVISFTIIFVDMSGIQITQWCSNHAQWGDKWVNITALKIG